MKNSERSHSRFNARPSVSFNSSTNNPTPFRKRASTITESTSGEKFLTFKDFDYVIRKSFDQGEPRQNQFDKDINFPNGTEQEKDHLAKALAKNYPLFRTSSLEDLLHSEVSKEDLECIFTTSVYIISNYFGACGPTSEEPQALLAYINQILPLQSKIKHECLERSKKIKAPEYVFNVKVVEAKNLIPSDPDGMSDPYCKLWMNNEKEHAKETCVKEHTLNPKWNDSFCFRIRDFNYNVLHIEVWDQDPQGFTETLREVENIRGIGGCCLFCRDCCRMCCCCCRTTDDFIAKADISLKEIYSEGIDDWIALKNNKYKSMGGQLHIFAEFKVLRPKCILDALKRHLMLLKICLLQSLKENGNLMFNIIRWEQILSPAAFTLMFQHRVQSSLVDAEDVLCRFIVFVYLMQNQYPFNYQFLYSVIDESYESMQQLLSTDAGMESSLEDLYRETVDDVYNLCISVITELHSIDLTESETKCKEFEFILRCLNTCHNILGKEGFPWEALKSEALVWFEEIGQEMREVEPAVRSDFIVKTLNFIISYHAAADKVVKNIFPDRSYTSVTCDVFDSMLGESLKFHITNIVKESVSVTGEFKEKKLKDALDVFTKVKEIDEFICKALSVSSSGLRIADFRDWFGINIIQNWFYWKQEIIIHDIRLIISGDNLENAFIECAERLEKQSLSVKLTANLIKKELIQLWNLVSHPNYPKCDSIFLKVLHSSCIKYTEFILGLIHSNNILSNFRTGGKKKLCVIANNLWSLAMFVQKTISDTVITIPSNVYDTKSSLKFICLIICIDMGKELEYDLVNQIKEVVAADSRKKQKQAVKAYVNWITHLFNEEDTEFMAFEIHLLFMREIWKSVINVIRYYKEVFKDSVASANICQRIFCRRPSVLSGLLAILTETENIIFIDDRKKLEKFMWTDDFRTLKDALLQSGVHR